MKKAVIFDFDGTIADSMAVVQQIFYDLTKHPTIDDPKKIEAFRQMPARTVASKLGVSPWQLPRLIIKGRRVMSQRMDQVPPFKGIEAVIEVLAAQDVELFVLSSNSTQNVQHFLNHHQLRQYFKGVYGSVGLLGKAAAIRKTLRQNNLVAADCVYVGDEVRDVDGAKKASVPVIAVGWGYNTVLALEARRPDGVAHSPQELLDMIQTL